VEEALHGNLADAQRVPGLGYWTGFMDGQFVGVWLLRSPGPAEQAAKDGQLGSKLLRRYWKQGLGSEGSRELIRHGFQDLGLARIHAMAAATNTASQATLTALGLRRVREFLADAEWFPPGTDLRTVEYAITQENWHGAHAT
jgi:RimJ/RimL family protein N-acetyltransferase